LLIFFFKNDTTPVVFLILVARSWGMDVLHIKKPKQFEKPIYNHKKQKKITLTLKINPRSKFLPISDLPYQARLKKKKHLTRINFSYRIEVIDTKIFLLRGWN